MASYKVSYGMLSQQGEELKQLAKIVDGYAEKINCIRGKLGSDHLLEQVRANLTKFGAQLGESRTILQAAGELLSKTVEDYSSGEARQVNKVDQLKAHNRDFYKNPVTVASVGTTGAASAAPETVVNYTNNSTNITYYAETGTSTPVSAASAAKAVPISAESAAQAAGRVVKADAGPADAKIAAAAGFVGGAVGAGAVESGLYLKKRKNEQTAKAASATPQDDLELRLAQARERARLLGKRDES